MNSKLQKALIGAGGFLIGAGVANVLTTLYVKKRANKIVDEFITSVQDEINDMNASLALAQEIADSYLQVLKENKLGPFETPEGAAAFLLDDVEQKIDYTKFDQNTRMSPKQAHEFVQSRLNDVIITKEVEPADGEESDEVQSAIDPPRVFEREDVSVYEAGEGYSDSAEEEESSQEADAVDPFFVNRDHTRPFLISFNEFWETEDEFDKEQLLYYSGDQILTDVKNVPINEKRKFIDALAAFGDKEHFNDSNQVFLRDSTNSIDYEITREDGIKYVVAVLGEEDPEGPRGRARARRANAQQANSDDENGS